MVPRKFLIVSFTMRLIEIAAAVLILILAAFFRGGLAMVHPVLMLIGPLLLTGKGTVLYETRTGTRDYKMVAHLSLHFLAVCLSLIGPWSAWKFPSGKGGDNFLPDHFAVGLFTLLFFIIQLAFGVVTFWSHGGCTSSDRGHQMWQLVFGPVIYVFAVLTCGVGFLESSKLLQARQISPCSSTEASLMNWLGFMMLVLCGLEYLRVLWEGHLEIPFPGNSD